MYSPYLQVLYPNPGTLNSNGRRHKRARAVHALRDGKPRGIRGAQYQECEHRKHRLDLEQEPVHEAALKRGNAASLNVWRTLSLVISQMEVGHALTMQRIHITSQKRKLLDLKASCDKAIGCSRNRNSS